MLYLNNEWIPNCRTHSGLLKCPPQFQPQPHQSVNEAREQMDRMCKLPTSSNSRQIVCTLRQRKSIRTVLGQPCLRIHSSSEQKCLLFSCARKTPPTSKLGLFVHKILFFRSTTKNLVRFCFSRSATKVTLRVIQGALAGVCVYAAALPCCEDLPPDACVPASSPVHPPCELTSLHVHVERASAHVVIRISLQMRRLALTCAPTANRVDCTNTSQEPENCVY